MRALLLCALGCASLPQPTERMEEPAVQGEEERLTFPAQEPGPCEGHSGLILSLPEEVNVACDIALCIHTIPLHILNCGEHSEWLRRVELRRPGGRVVGIYAFDDMVLTPGDFRERTLAVREGEYELLVDDGVLRRSFRVVDASRDAARAACDECNGDWGPQGRGGTPGCNCRTVDAGKPCLSSTECQGACLFEGVRTVSHPPPGAPACTAWVMEGVCSERTAIFGCRALLREAHYSCHRPYGAPIVCGD